MNLREGWYSRWRIGHTAFSIIVTLLVVLIRVAGQSSVGSQLAPSPAEIVVLVVSVSFFGVPHGATDHLVGACMFRPRFPKSWLFVFVMVYLAMMAIVVLSWWAFPSISLALFLLMSVVHWGLGDAEEELTPSSLYAAEVCLRGALPIFLPCVAFKDYVVKIFSWLVGTKPSEQEKLAGIMTGMTWASMPVVVTFLLCMGWHVLCALSTSPRSMQRSWTEDASSTRETSPNIQRRRLRHALTAGELVTLIVLCVSCTPLTSFMIYFCLWHSFRHIMVVSSAAFDDKRAAPALTSFFLQASPFTLATLAIAFWSWDSIVGSGSTEFQLESAEAQTQIAAMAQVVFIGLSAVTVPHMVITEVSQVRQRAMSGPSGKTSPTELTPI